MKKFILVLFIFLIGCEQDANKPLISSDDINNFLKNFGLSLRKSYDESQKEVADWKKIARKTPECSQLSPNGQATKNTNLLISPKDGAEAVTKIEKDEKIAIISRLEKLPQWYLIYTKKCEQGYVKEDAVGKKVTYTSKKMEIPDNQNVVVFDPVVTSGGVFYIRADGFVSLTGAVNKKNGINKVVVNNEDLVIESDNTFTATLNVPKEGKEVKVIVYKNDTKIDTLSFNIKVRN